MTQRIVFLFLALPLVMRVGVLILVAGGSLDLLYHVAPLAWTVDLDRHLGAQGMGAHILTLVGMIVTLLGLPVRRAQIAPIAGAVSERSSSIDQ